MRKVRRRGAIHLLTTREVEAATKDLYDGGGLGLQVKRTEDGGFTKSWEYIFEALDSDPRGKRKRRSMGLGAHPDVSLAEARKLAAEARAIRRDNRDPIAERNARRDAARAAAADTLSFDDAWKQYIEANRAGWTNAIHAKQWEQTLTDYASPHIGKKPVADITAADIVRVLRKIWETRPVTADRLLNRCELVLAWATARGYRKGDNPANRDLLKHLLPARAKRQVKHHAALTPAEIPALVAKLRALDTVESQTLEFLILTATRTAEVRQARWSEFDIPAKRWTVPVDRMKGRREHRIPLSGRACEILRRRQAAGGTYVFGGERLLGRNALLDLMRDKLEIVEATPHGLRSSFADWATEIAKADPDVREWALAHKVGTATSRAYARGDRLEERAELMERWANFVGGRKTPDNVRELPKRRA
jgi:integrase